MNKTWIIIYPMRLKIGLLLLLLLNLGICALAQDTTAPVFFEKAYLHTDRDAYGQGEDIWFKAYVVNARDNGVINYSHNLYVELIGPGAKLVKRETIRLENGLGNGDFKLADTLPAGRYRLRAYTNWMRNFGDNFIFEKNITLLQTTKTPVIAATKKNKNYATATSTTPTPTVRFFPEGGSLVEGISAIVAVKAEGPDGKGIAAKGSVVSSSGDTVSRFNCDSLGMGLFALLPVKGQTYRALIHSIQLPHDTVITIPAALSKGLTLQVKQTDSVIHAIINSTGQLTAGTVSLTVKHGGKTQFSQPLQLQNQQTAIKIPTASLPEGISAITLYDAQGKPNCERLVYIHHPGNVNKLTIVTDKKTYQPKEQVTVTIKALPNTSLSLAAVDAMAVPVQAENIVTYLNLQSEIKGNIEKPNRYFDTTNVNRFKQLDELLLTQGWRDFVWRRLEDSTLKLSYEPEQGINITGRVRRVGVNKGLPAISVTMHAPKAEGQKLFWATTDSAGRFGIYNTQFYGYQYFSFTARQSDKINRDGNSKGFSGGYIQVDSLLRDTLAVGSDAPVFKTDTLWMAQAAIDRIRKSLNLKADHNLKEVTIRANGEEAPPEIHPITLVEQKDYGNLAQYLLYMIDGAKLIWADPDRYIANYRVINGWTVFAPIPLIVAYADGTRPTGGHLNNEYLSQPMSNILKVTINKNKENQARLINLVIRPGVLEPKGFFNNTMADMTGYYRARVFYTPRPEEPNGLPDPRTNTIRWEPNITTDKNGEAAVSFYNTAQTGSIRLIVQGITNRGMPLVSTMQYGVK